LKRETSLKALEKDFENSREKSVALCTQELQNNRNSKNINEKYNHEYNVKLK